MPVAALLGFLPQLIQGGEALWGLVQKIRETAQQTGEWDSSHEEQFQTALMAQGQAKESQPDAQA